MRKLLAILAVLAFATPVIAAPAWAQGMNSTTPHSGIGICASGDVVSGLRANAPPICVANGSGSGIPNGAPPQIVGYSATNTGEAETVSGDCTFSRTGANAYSITCTKTNGTAFSGLATASVGTGLTLSSGTLSLTTPVSVTNGGNGCGAPTTFSGLPGTPAQGMICSITDATACAAGTAVTVGGGSTFCVLSYTGSSWMPAGAATASGTGSGTVNSGNAGQLAVFPSNGTSVSGSNSPATGMNMTGSILQTAIGTPSAPSIVSGFTSGTTDYYFCVAEDSNGGGNDTVPSSGTGTTGTTGTMSCGGQTGAVKYYLLRTTSSTVPINASATLLVGSCTTTSGTACNIADANNTLTYFSPTEYDETGMPPLADRNYLISFQPSDAPGGSNTSITMFAPRGVQNNDFLVACITAAATPTSQITNTQGGFTKIGSGALNSNVTTSLWYKVANNESGNYIWSWTGNAYVETGLFDFRGLTNNVDSTATNYGTPSSVSNFIISAHGAPGTGNKDWRVPEIFIACVNGNDGATPVWTQTDNFWQEVSTNQQSFWIGYAPYTKFQMQYVQPQVTVFTATSQNFAWGVTAIY